MYNSALAEAQSLCHVLALLAVMVGMGGVALSFGLQHQMTHVQQTAEPVASPYSSGYKLFRVRNIIYKGNMYKKDNFHQ